MSSKIYRTHIRVGTVKKRTIIHFPEWESNSQPSRSQSVPVPQQRRHQHILLACCIPRIAGSTEGTWEPLNKNDYSNASMYIKLCDTNCPCVEFVRSISTVLGRMFVHTIARRCGRQMLVCTRVFINLTIYYH